MEGRLGAEPARGAETQGGRPVQEARRDLLQPPAPGDQGLLRALDVRLQEPHRRPARLRLPGRPARLAARRQADEDRLVLELGRQPGRRARLRRPRPDGGAHAAAGVGEGAVRVRRDVHVLPAAHLRALPQPVVRGVVPVRGDVQALGGRHRPGRPGPLPGLADVRDRMPVQEGVLQPPHRQGREVHLLLPAHRDRSADGLFGDLRRPAEVPGRGAVRRRQGDRGGLDAERTGPVRGPAGRLPRPRGPRGAAGRTGGGHPVRLDRGGPALPPCTRW